VDFLIVLIEFFSLGVTAEALRENRLEIGVFEGRESLSVEVDVIVYQQLFLHR